MLHVVCGSRLNLSSSADFVSDNYVDAPEGNDIHDVIRTPTCWLLPFPSPTDYIHLLRH